MKKYYEEEVDEQITEEVTEDPAADSVEDPAPVAEPKTTTFRIGDIGQDVKALQKELGLPETGIYDAATDKAARR